MCVCIVCMNMCVQVHAHAGQRKHVGILLYLPAWFLALRCWVCGYWYTQSCLAICMCVRDSNSAHAASAPTYWAISSVIIYHHPKAGSEYMRTRDRAFYESHTHTCTWEDRESHIHTSTPESSFSRFIGHQPSIASGKSESSYVLQLLATEN